MEFESLAQLLIYRAANDGERIFLSSPEEQLDVSYGDFYQAASQFAQYLARRGLQPKDRVALLLENGLSWVVAFWGILLAGGIVVPLNPKYKPAETAGLLTQAAVRLIVADEAGAQALPPGIGGAGAGRYPAEPASAEALLVIPLFSPESTLTTASVAANAEDEALLLFTSGSTGVPKGVVLTHGNLLAEAGYIQQGHRLTAQDIVLCILPFFHINGLVITQITPVFSGGRAVVPRRFSAGQFWQWIDCYQATWFSAVPTILSILLSKADTAARPSSSLRFARSASSSLPVAILAEFEKRFKVPVIEGYGLSEAGSQVATNPLPPAIRKAGSVGLPAGNRLQVVDEQGRPVPAGMAGEVVLQGANVSRGYLNNPEANRESFRDGWFYTGDLGYFDQDGYLFLTGRRKELINRAGEKISPREVDEVLYQLAGIAVAAAVGVPDKLFGEEIVAFVQLRPGAELSAGTVVAHCRECLADFKVPKNIICVDDFPKGPNGKIQRRKLVELYQQLTAGNEV